MCRAEVVGPRSSAHALRPWRGSNERPRAIAFSRRHAS
jgi:hypothetical protein